MHALISYDYTFLAIYIGWPGRVHDARVLTNSRIFQDTEAGNLLPNITKSINFCSSQGIEWSYIAEHASHFGGLWEGSPQSKV